MDEPYFLKAEQAPELQLAAGIRTNLMTGLKGEKVMVVQHNIDSGATAPVHSHPHEQHGLIFAGEGLLTFGAETRRLRQGEFYYLPPNLPHGILNPGPGQLIMIEIFFPVREDFINRLK